MLGEKGIWTDISTTLSRNSGIDPPLTTRRFTATFIAECKIIQCHFIKLSSRIPLPTLCLLELSAHSQLLCIVTFGRITTILTVNTIRYDMSMLTSMLVNQPMRVDSF